MKTCDSGWLVVINKPLDVLRHEVNQYFGAIPIEEGLELAHAISSPTGRIYEEECERPVPVRGELEDMSRQSVEIPLLRFHLLLRGNCIHLILA